MPRRLAVALIASLGIAAQPAAAAAPSPGCVPRATPPPVGAKLVSSRPVDRRVTDVTLASRAMASQQHVYVLLPPGYRTSRRRYPVLYLLHGALGSYVNWFESGAVESIVGRRPLIVVMPYDGYDGSYSDWYGTLAGSSGPAPAWETYHVDELIPWIDAHYRTEAYRRGRFVAGNSSGGGGAMKYAAAHPGLFGAAGAFSGAVDTDLDYPDYSAVSEALWGLTDVPGDGPDGHCTWGDPVSEHVVWLDNDPTYLAQNLRGTALWLASGTGQPGPYDSGQAYTDPTESTIWSMNQAFVAALDGAGVAHTDYFYGPGTHSWPYWRRDLTRFLNWLAPRLGRPPTFSYRSARASFSAWGWRFSVERSVREFVYLTDVSRSGLEVTGSGRLNVVTAALYSRGARYRVTAGALTHTVRAERSGRLRFDLDLGPSHALQQYRFGPNATNGWTHLRVRIARA